ncbi:hypothetical protein RHGRI_025350 [Rhododendron griersonianum]|uniref:Uncharacterized protein n=1 Tax=Rhododendron griersonianum TaxID=479676 RepID=A0AAV6IPE1_9ERIC|nr:hypothetical protein RHGRI_025350 [Rhododendron griersonianum]
MEKQNSFRGANMEKQVRDILQRFDADVVKELISKQNQEGETALYVAAENGHAHVVSELLKHLDLQTASIAAKNGLDAFHIASKQGHIAIGLAIVYMANGSLYDWLYPMEVGYKRPTLNWPLRYVITVGIARGLAWLHHNCNYRVTHGNI